MSEINLCPTCNASGDAPCVTKSGAPAKKWHATRQISQKIDEVRETAKQRFDRMKAERKTRESVVTEPPNMRPVSNRAKRRSNGMYKTVHRGAMRRKKRARLNEQVRAFFHPEPEPSVALDMIADK